MAGRRELGFFRRRRRRILVEFSRSLSGSLNWPKVKEEKSGCWFYQEAGVLSASGGFESTDIGELLLRRELTGEATHK